MATEKNEETILREMQETRAALTEKLETLEQKVVGTVENATSAVTETVGAIKDSVHETVNTVNESVKDGVESVKDLFDMPAHVQEHPWLMLGGSVAVGYFLGTLLTQKAQPTYAPPLSSPYSMPAASATSIAASAPAAANESMFGPELTKLKGLAMGVLFGTARELLLSSVPEHLGDQIKQLVDTVTKKAGGEPLPSSDWKEWAQTSSQTEPPAANSETFKETGNSHAAARRW